MFTKESITPVVQQLIAWHKEGKKSADGREFVKNNNAGKKMLTTYAQKESLPVEFELDGVPHVGTAQVSYSMNVIGVKPLTEAQAAGENASRTFKALKTRIDQSGEKLSPAERIALAELLAADAEEPAGEPAA
jgi:hypothetical protein